MIGFPTNIFGFTTILFMKFFSMIIMVHILYINLAIKMCSKKRGELYLILLAALLLLLSSCSLDEITGFAVKDGNDGKKSNTEIPTGAATADASNETTNETLAPAQET